MNLKRVIVDCCERKRDNENSDLSVVKRIRQEKAKTSLPIKRERVFIVHLIIKTILLRKKQLIEWIVFKKEGRETRIT